VKPDNVIMPGKWTLMWCRITNFYIDVVQPFSSVHTGHRCSRAVSVHTIHEHGPSTQPDFLKKFLSETEYENRDKRRERNEKSTVF